MFIWKTRMYVSLCVLTTIPTAMYWNKYVAWTNVFQFTLSLPRGQRQSWVRNPGFLRFLHFCLVSPLICFYGVASLVLVGPSARHRRSGRWIFTGHPWPLSTGTPPKACGLQKHWKRKPAPLGTELVGNDFPCSYGTELTVLTPVPNKVLTQVLTPSICEQPHFCAFPCWICILQYPGFYFQTMSLLFSCLKDLWI